MQTSEDVTDVHLTLQLEFEDEIYKSIHKLHKFMLVRESGDFFKTLLSKKWRKGSILTSQQLMNQESKSSGATVDSGIHQRTMSNISMASSSFDGVLEYNINLPDLLANYYEPVKSKNSQKTPKTLTKNTEILNLLNLSSISNKSFDHAFDDSFVSQTSANPSQKENLSVNKETSSTSLSQNCNQFIIAKNDAMTNQTFVDLTQSPVVVSSQSETKENFITPKPLESSPTNEPENLAINETKLNRLLNSVFHYIYYKENVFETKDKFFFEHQITMSELMDYIIIADYFAIHDWKTKLIENFSQKFFNLHLEMFVLIEIFSQYVFLQELYEIAIDYVRVNFGKIVSEMCEVCIGQHHDDSSSSEIVNSNLCSLFRASTSRQNSNSSDQTTIKTLSNMSNIEEFLKIDFQNIDINTLKLIDEPEETLKTTCYGDQCLPSTKRCSSPKVFNTRSKSVQSPTLTPRKKVGKFENESNCIGNSSSWKNTFKNYFRGSNSSLVQTLPEISQNQKQKQQPALLKMISYVSFQTISKILENNPNAKDNQIFDIIILYIISHSHYNKITELYKLKEHAIQLLRNYMKIQIRDSADQTKEILNWIRSESESEYSKWKSSIESLRSKYSQAMIRKMNRGSSSIAEIDEQPRQPSERYYVFKYFLGSALKIFSTESLNYDDITKQNIRSFLTSILKIWLQCNDNDIKIPATPKSRRRSLRLIERRKEKESVVCGSNALASKKILTRGQKRSLSPAPQNDVIDLTDSPDLNQGFLDKLPQESENYWYWGRTAALGPNFPKNLLKTPKISRNSNETSIHDPVAFQQMASMEIIDYQTQDKNLATKFVNSPMKSRIPFDAALIIGGWQGNDKNDVNYGACTLCHVYDQHTDQWLQHEKQSLTSPLNLCYNGICYMEPFVYIAGGYDGNNKHTAGLAGAYSLNVKTLEWKALADMISKRLYLTCSAYPEDNSFLAVGGGTQVTEIKTIRNSETGEREKVKLRELPPFKNDKGKLSLVEQYNIDTDTWRSLPYMRYFRSDSSSIVINHTLIVCGGFDGKKCLDSVEYFNFKGSQMWCELTSMGELRSGLSLVYYQDSLVAMGGYPGKRTDNYGSRIDGERLDTWEILPGITELFKNINLADKIADKNCEEYKTLESKQDKFRWKALPSKFNTGRSNFGACVLNDSQIIICGGYNHNTTTNRDGDPQGGTLNKCERFVGSLYNQVKSKITGLPSNKVFRKTGWEEIDSLPVELSAMTVITVSSSDEPLRRLLGK